MSKKDPKLFDASASQVLERGLNAMTKMCDVLSTQNEILNTDITKLKNKIARMRQRLLENGIEAD